uniref:Uncharacterized protein n=1 Tax=Chenopodium quinoa TaxID=63459 RepID=A0A803M1W7_CHEQI
MNEAQEVMVNMDEVEAELQSERRKNAELLQRISALEAQIQHERDKSSSTSLMKINISNPNSTEDSMKHKRQKIEKSAEKLDINDNNLRSPKDLKHEKGVLSWMCMDNETQSLLFDKSKDVESMLECKGHTDDSDDNEDELCTYEDAQDNVKIVDEEGVGQAIGKGITCMNSKEISARNRLNEIDVSSMSQKLEQDWEEVKKSKGFRNLSLQKKPPKVGFCPKEVRGILESCVLDMKNAQAHTMRKIIVFASLGLRHGCDDMYELNFNHFSI